MSYASGPEVFEPVMRVLRGAFDFRGRARRTDGILYDILVSLTFTVLGFALNPYDAPTSISDALDWTSVFVQLPLIAWFVRRMHDYGFSGWAALPFLGWIAVNSRSASLLGIDPDALRDNVAFQVANVAVVIAFFAAVFWTPNEGTNRFGPNPRFDNLEGEIASEGFNQ